MKVMIICNDPNKQGREERINNIVDAFGKDKDFVFYAYGTKNDDMKMDNVTFIPAWEKYTVDGGIAFSKYIVDSERMLLVFEDGLVPKDLIKMLNYHVRGQFGITLSLYEKNGSRYAYGVYVVEREYLDLANGLNSFEQDICVLCGENGELGIYNN